MNTLRLIGCILLMSPFAAAGPATAPATPPYRGSFEYTYTQFVLRVESHDDKHLSWTFPGGAETVEVDRRDVAPGVYLTSWTEKSGAMVAQVANYNAGTLNSVLIVGGKRQVLTGTIKRLTP